MNRHAQGRYAVGSFLGLSTLQVLRFTSSAAEPLQDRIDALIEAWADGWPARPLADDAEFLRRVTLDLAGTIPKAEDVRAFLADWDPDNRSGHVEHLRDGPDSLRRPRERLHVVHRERRGEHPEWRDLPRTADEPRS